MTIEHRAKIAAAVKATKALQFPPCIHGFKPASLCRLCKNAYYREKYAINIEKLRAQKRESYYRNKQKVLAYQHDRYRRLKKIINKKSRDRYAKNKTWILQHQREVQLSNPAIFRERKHIYNKRHWEKWIEFHYMRNGKWKTLPHIEIEEPITENITSAIMERWYRSPDIEVEYVKEKTGKVRAIGFKTVNL